MLRTLLKLAEMFAAVLRAEQIVHAVQGIFQGHCAGIQILNQVVRVRTQITDDRREIGEAYIFDSISASPRGVPGAQRRSRNDSEEIIGERTGLVIVALLSVFTGTSG